jgi:hypothetical protein
MDDGDTTRAFFELAARLERENALAEDSDERIVCLRLGTDGVLRCPDCGCQQFVEGPRQLIGSPPVSYLLSPKHLICASCGVLLSYGHGYREPKKSF